MTASVSSTTGTLLPDTADEDGVSPESSRTSSESNDLDSRGKNLYLRYVAQLCLSCRELDFSIHKFVVSNTGISRNEPASAANSTQSDSGTRPSFGRGFRLNSGASNRAFASFGQVQERRNTCPFCGLACRAVERYSGSRVEATASLYVSWEVDGREVTSSERMVNRTRRVRLSWSEKSGKEEAVYIVFVAPTGSWLGSDADAGAARATQFLGRGFAGTREKQALMKSWVDLCVNKHDQNCQDKPGGRAEFTELVKGTYFGVIDVVDMQLKELPIVNGEPGRYVALSYVWGNRPWAERPYVTTRSNVMRHIQHGGLENVWDRLPRTIQDAILLVSRLGERYLWIDSLCIVQDSTSSWELNAKSMHLVYGNAHFTICAADGKDAETGLLAVDSTLRKNPPLARHGLSPSTISSPPPSSSFRASNRQRQRTTSPFPSPRPPPAVPVRTPSTTSTDEMRGRLKATEEEPSHPLTAEILPGITLLVSRPPEAVIQDSHWNRRGWTFQERLLSRRCLVFAEGQVYFQCRSAVISQHIFTSGGANSWSLDWTNSPLRTLGELRRRAFWFYMTCVHLYTGRHLTKPRDVLTAFEGVAWLLQDRMNAPLFYGLPMSHFDLALLWMPVDSLYRRQHRGTHRSGMAQCTQDEMGNCSCKKEEEGYGGKEFPSWSWCGWSGGKIEYRQNMVDGCLLDVQQWLRNHTWILWYVRDNEGDLRPLWDRNAVHEDRSEERRWKGYAGKPPRSARVQSPRSSPSKDRGERSGGPPPSTSGYRPRRKAAGSLASPPPQGWARQSNAAYLDRLPHQYYDDIQSPGDYPARPSRRPYEANMPSHEGQRYLSVRDQDPSAEGGFAGIPSNPFPVPPREQPGGWGRGEHYAPAPAMGQYSSGAYPPPSAPSTISPSGSSDSTESETDTTSHVSEDGTAADSYGRPPRPSVEGLSATEFTGILPDNPFGIKRGPFPEDIKDHARAMPILQFWTWRAELLVIIRHDDRNPSATADPVSGLCQCDVVDKAGDWCGAITLPRNWIEGHEGIPLQFIAISDAKGFTQEECPVWNYYIPKERDESEWDLFYVMLLERNRERALWERVTVGKVFQAAFGGAPWDEIKLG